MLFKMDQQYLKKSSSSYLYEMLTALVIKRYIFDIRITGDISGGINNTSLIPIII